MPDEFSGRNHSFSAMPIDACLLCFLRMLPVGLDFSLPGGDFIMFTPESIWLFDKISFEEFLMVLFLIDRELSLCFRPLLTLLPFFLLDQFFFDLCLGIFDTGNLIIAFGNAWYGSAKVRYFCRYVVVMLHLCLGDDGFYYTWEMGCSGENLRAVVSLERFEVNRMSSLSLVHLKVFCSLGLTAFFWSTNLL